MKIEILQEADLHTFSPFYANYFNMEGDQWSEERAYRRLHQMWSVEDSICLKAIKNNTIQGILMGYLNWFDQAPLLHIFEILVLKNSQHQGIGLKLLQEAESIAKAKGATAATLETLDDELHENFYRKGGYHTNSHLVFKKKKL